MTTRRGFTMIELMVVVAIIVILAGMILGVLSILRRQQKIASTWDLMTHVTTAVDQYLREAPRLGDATSTNFKNDPWEFFFKSQHRQKKQPLLELPLTQVVKKTGSGSCVRAESLQTATHIVDHFGTTPANVLSFTILNHNKGTGDKFIYANCILLRSSASSPSDPKDDLIFAFNSEKANWRKVKVDDLDEFAAELDRSPVPVLDTAWKNPLDD